jgi:ABC-2 type transport system ATP-binding protein
VSQPDLAVWSEGLGKRYGGCWALRDCSVVVPSGRISALVGANGAGKSTLLHLLSALRRPTEGRAAIFGCRPEQSSRFLSRIAFVAQEMPVYPNLSIDEHLRAFRRMNPAWDEPLFRSRVGRMELPLTRRCGSLSGGQRALVALALALAKRPRLLLLDEPAAALDPLARREFFRCLEEAVGEHEVTVVLSSHLITDLERISDHIVLLARGRTQLCDDIDRITAAHRIIDGPVESIVGRVEGKVDVVAQDRSGERLTVLARLNGDSLDPRWNVRRPGIEEIVLAYMGAGEASMPAGRDLVAR